MVAPILFGAAFGMKWTLDASSLLTILGLAELDTTDAIRAMLAPGAVFFDIGAGDGLLTLIASRTVGKSGMVYAFEDREIEFTRLRNHIERNCADNVIAVPASPANIRLDRAIRAGALPAPQAIHLRAPGEAAEVLRSAAHLLRHDRPAIILDAEPDEDSACRALLRRYGYELTTCPPERIAQRIEIVALPN